MKSLKILLVMIFLLTFSWIQLAEADIPTIQLNWTLTGETGQSNFDLYYSYDSNMEVKVLHNLCSQSVETTPGKYTMTCTNIPIIKFPFFIQIGYDSPIENKVVYSNIQEIITGQNETHNTPNITNVKLIK